MGVGGGQFTGGATAGSRRAVLAFAALLVAVASAVGGGAARAAAAVTATGWRGTISVERTSFPDCGQNQTCTWDAGTDFDVGPSRSAPGSPGNLTRATATFTLHDTIGIAGPACGESVHGSQQWTGTAAVAFDQEGDQLTIDVGGVLQGPPSFEMEAPYTDTCPGTPAGASYQIGESPDDPIFTVTVTGDSVSGSVTGYDHVEWPGTPVTVRYDLTAVGPPGNGRGGGGSTSGGGGAGQTGGSGSGTTGSGGSGSGGNGASGSGGGQPSPPARLIGINCGIDRFDWATTFGPRAEKKGKPTCSFLLSNSFIKGVFATGADAIDAAVSGSFGQLVLSDVAIAAAHRGAKLAQDELVGELNKEVAKRLAGRIETASWSYVAETLGAPEALAAIEDLDPFFAVGNAAGMLAPKIAEAWLANQVERKNACIQLDVTFVRKTLHVDWSPVYSVSALKDPKDLSDSETWAGEKKNVSWGPDRIQTHGLAFRCGPTGEVQTIGTGAGVFSRPVALVLPRG